MLFNISELLSLCSQLLLWDYFWHERRHFWYWKLGKEW